MKKFHLCGLVVLSLVLYNHQKLAGGLSAGTCPREVYQTGGPEWILFYRFELSSIHVAQNVH